MKPFPWAEAMGFGFGVLRLAPDTFWRMTPRELTQAIIAVRGPVAVPIDRGALDQLMNRFPDKRTGMDNGG
ncbi:MAG: phage tail assembly chaperone [Proteobacteria bacterium]|nr:phage tail assembly chaperone [Pseudomonadota bacterium]